LTGWPSVTRIAGGALLILYPIAVWLGITAAGGRVVSLVVLGVLAVVIPLRVVTARRSPHLRALVGPYLVLVVLAVLAAVWRDPRFLFALPVLVNAGLLASFGGSLARGRTPIVESFARAVHGADLPAEKVRYCRRVTGVWCVFFLLNGLTALWLAVAGPLRLWALYTGVVSYLLMAALFAGEYAVRRIRFG
jgi:uncharacterized membrane protein